MSWEPFVNASVIVTLLAGLITLITVASYFATRAQIEVRLQENGVVGIHNNGRNQAIKNIRMGFAVLSEQGTVTNGSGADPWGGDIVPKTGRWMFLRSVDEPGEARIEMHDGYINMLPVVRGRGAIIEFYWQHPVTPWLIQRTIVLSEPARDIGRQKAVLLSRSEGKKEWERRVDAPMRSMNF